MQNTTVKNVPSLISRDESTAIKGLLMLLIVFGHIGMLTTNFATGERTFFWNWLYSFHVFIFLILPIIYGYQNKNVIKKADTNEKNNFVNHKNIINDLKHNLIKIGVPYFWFFLLSAIVFVSVGGGQFDLTGMLYAFFFGNQLLMDKYIGFNLMWFLPAMLALTMLKSVFYNSDKIIKAIIIGISLILWALSIFNVVYRSEVGMYVPFSISQAFYFVVLGLIARFIIEKQWPFKYLMPVVLLLVVTMTMLLYFQENIQIISVNMASQLLMPILMFLLLFSFRKILLKSQFLKFIGTYSLQIYLVHVFVINALVVFFTYFMQQSLVLGIVIYMLTLAISSGISLVLVKVQLFRKILFPN